jgi:hypothetical protein
MKSFIQLQPLRLYILTLHFSLKKNTNVVLAFEVPGGWLKEKDFATASVLQVREPIC